MLSKLGLKNYLDQLIYCGSFELSTLYLHICTMNLNIIDKININLLKY